MSKVIVYNRQDCCQYNLYGALLELVDSKNNIQGAKRLYSSNKQIISFEAHSRGLSMATTAVAAFNFVSTSDKYANLKYMACKRFPGGHGLREHMLSRCYIPALGNSMVDGTAPNYFAIKKMEIKTQDSSQAFTGICTRFVKLRLCVSMTSRQLLSESQHP